MTELDLIAAFTAWERWANAVSAAAEAATARGERPPRLNGSAGRDVANKLVDAEMAMAQSLGITHMELHNRVIAVRRSGHTIAESITALRATP